MKRSALFSSLKLKKQIALVFKEGKKVYAPDCYLRFVVLPEKAPSPWMVVITVPRTLKKAVARNRAKRVVRAALEIALRDLPLPTKHYAVAIFIKESFVALKLPQRVEQLRKLFSLVQQEVQEEG